MAVRDLVRRAGSLFRKLMKQAAQGVDDVPLCRYRKRGLSGIGSLSEEPCARQLLLDGGGGW